MQTYLFDGEVIDKMVVVFIQTAVEGYTVAVEQQVLQGAHPLEPEGTLDAIREVRVVENDVEAKGLCPQCNRLPDSSWKTTFHTHRVRLVYCKPPRITRLRNMASAVF